MRMRPSGVPLVPVFATLLLLACGGDKTEQTPAAAAPPAGSGLSAFQMEHGIGPVTEPITLKAVDDDDSEEMAEEGKKLFEAKCAVCHKMEERYVGPALGGVTERRSPAYVMNMIMNPDGMYTKHPEARKMLAEYMTQMPNLGTTQDEARKILEYLRTQPTSTAGK
jgi:mono/diheme cytochrome c family protein